MTTTIDEKSAYERDGLVGSTVSHYRITRCLGHGGMGVVYCAVDERLGRQVALKFLPSTLTTDDELVSRFMQEARAASALDHPNIAVVHEIDHTDAGQPFIVMAYYDGETLRERLQRGPLPLSEVVEYAIQIADGLQRAHDEGIIHRDIKPENLIVTRYNRVKIVDFGVAKIQQSNLTRTSTSLGTIAYMSPEQIRGQPVDGRTDLWSLGVILYEMLTGRHPFAGQYEAAVIYSTLNTEPEPLSPEVPAELARIVDALLKKDCDARYGNAGEVVRDLEKVRISLSDGTEANAAAASQKVANDDRSSDWRQFVTLRVGTGVALLLMAGIIAIWALGGSPVPDPPPSALPAESSEQVQRHVADGLAYFADERLEPALREFERAITLDSLHADAWNSRAAVLIKMKRYDEALIAGRRATDLAGDDGSAHYNLAIALEETGAVSEAADVYRTAIALDRRFTAAYSALGNLLIQEDRPDEAVRVLSEGIAANPSSEHAFLIYKNLGKAYLALDRPADAIAPLQKSLEQRPDWPETLSLLARSLELSGRTDESQPYWDRYLEVETDSARRHEAVDRLRNS